VNFEKALSDKVISCLHCQWQNSFCSAWTKSGHVWGVWSDWTVLGNF